jgi:hypothetical protein
MLGVLVVDSFYSLLLSEKKVIEFQENNKEQK